MMIKKTCVLFVRVKQYALKAVYFYKAKHYGCGSADLCTKSLHCGQLIKLMCRETKVMAPEACQMPPGITDAYLTSKT